MPTLRSIKTLDSNALKNQIMNQVILKLHQIKEDDAEDLESYLEFSNIDPQIAEKVFESIDRQIENRTTRAAYNSFSHTLSFTLMPTFTHDSHQAWVIFSLQQASKWQVFTDEENKNMRVSSGSRYEKFMPPYNFSRKESDQCITPAGMYLPTIVVESGWSKSRANLHRDRDLWLYGGYGSVQLILIIKWNKNMTYRTVRGNIEVFELDAQGNVHSLQTEDIFPAPLNSELQRISISKQQIFGQTMPNLQNPTQLVHLYLNDLRDIAREDMAKDNWTPA